MRVIKGSKIILYGYIGKVTSVFNYGKVAVYFSELSAVLILPVIFLEWNIQLNCFRVVPKDRTFAEGVKNV